PVFGLFLSLFAVIFLIFYRLHNPDFGPSAAWLLVFSGAVGNLIDKMFVKSLETGAWVFSLGPKPNHVSGVVDFVECIWFGWTPGYDMLSFSLPFFGTFRPLAWLAWPVWPLFNFADSLIVVGTCMLVFSMLLTKPQPEA
ncbi:MAG TPA: signal peptidase II, partial [Leptospiraceae bacterium]|nr:signal peptidase II [Leptospiraceae bacterium]